MKLFRSTFYAVECCLFAIIPVVIVLWGIWRFLPYSIVGGCTDTPLSNTPSPDRRWNATVVSVFCEAPFLTYVTSVVRLVDPTNPRRVLDIMGVDDSYPPQPPRPVWKSRDLLEITVPHTGYLQILQQEFDGIQFAIRSDLDDPVARAAWRARVGPPPEQ